MWLPDVHAVAFSASAPELQQIRALPNTDLENFFPVEVAITEIVFLPGLLRVSINFDALEILQRFLAAFQLAAGARVPVFCRFDSRRFPHIDSWFCLRAPPGFPGAATSVTSSLLRRVPSGSQIGNTASGDARAHPLSCDGIHDRPASGSVAWAL